MTSAREELRAQIKGWDRSILPNKVLLQQSGLEGGTLDDGALVTFWMLHLWSRRKRWLFASPATIARKRGKGKRCIQKHIAKLVAAGWIERQERPWRGRIIDVLALVTPSAEPVEEGIEFLEQPPSEGGDKIDTPLAGVAQDSPPCEGDESEFAGVRTTIRGGANLSSPEEEKEGKQKEGKQIDPDGSMGTSSEKDQPLEDSEGRSEDSEEGGAESAEEDSIHAAALARLQTRSVSHVGKKASADTDEPKRRTRARVPEWPPTRGSDVYAKWAEEARAAFPGYAPPRPQAQEHGVCKHLLARYEDDPDSLLAIIRVALYDWTAIQATIETWYTKGKAVPEPQHILKLAGQLAAKLESGVTSNLHRVSDYYQRFVKGTARDTQPSYRPVNKESPAAIKRREADERAKRAAAKRKKRDEERWAPRDVERAG